jgi:hypothetical protein
MTTTLQAIEAEHQRLGAMIQALKQQRAFLITVQAPALAEGETHIGTLISADGTRCEHLILLPGKFEGAWKESLAWAESMGGQLPDRVESAMLFAHAKAEFQPKAYWTREQHAANSDCAWYQVFADGGQYDSFTDSELRARAVRRSPIQSFCH